jgi:hypothetical protein
VRLNRRHNAARGRERLHDAGGWLGLEHAAPHLALAVRQIDRDRRVVDGGLDGRRVGHLTPALGLDDRAGRSAVGEEFAEHVARALRREHRLLDDREERAGSKFKDADLYGIPWRVAIGARGVKEGIVELKARRGGEVRNVPIASIVDELKALLA